jgi:TonB family protein
MARALAYASGLILLFATALSFAQSTQTSPEQTPLAVPGSPKEADSETAAQSAVARAAAAAAATRGGKAFESHPPEPLEIISDTQGVDFRPYVWRVGISIERNWNASSVPGAKKGGEVSVEFTITPTGKIGGMRLVKSSGAKQLDAAAWWGIRNSNPFPPLPREFKGPSLVLRANFTYRSNAEQSGQTKVQPQQQNY